jgi:hypothetical protein
MSAVDQRLERGRPRGDFRKAFVLATQTALALLAALVVARRLSGAFDAAISPAVPCVAATTATVLSLASLSLLRTAGRPVAARRALLVTVLVAVLSPMALGAALWATPSALVGGYLMALWVAASASAVVIHDAAGGSILTTRLRSALSGSEAKREWVALPARPPAFSSHLSGEHTDGKAGAAPSNEPSDHLADEEPTSSPDEEILADDSIVQWMTRRRLPEGGEVIEGAVSIDFEPGERIGVAHLSFLPPLGGDPDADCHLLCDFDARVRVTVAKSYGLRIEARRSTDGQPATLSVAFCAQAPSAANRAAAA